MRLQRNLHEKYNEPYNGNSCTFDDIVRKSHLFRDHVATLLEYEKEIARQFEMDLRIHWSRHELYLYK